MAVQKKIKTKQMLLDAINYFKEIPFYNTYIEQPKIKRSENIDLLTARPIYEELRVVKKIKHLEDMQWDRKFNWLIKKDPLSQLKGSKLYIKDLFNDLLDETKDFKHRITVKMLLKKYKDTEIEFSQFNNKNSDKS